LAKVSAVAFGTPQESAVDDPAIPLRRDTPSIRIADLGLDEPGRSFD
jgi:hypothetical protein